MANTDDDRRRSRRAVLATAGALAGTALTGCLGSGRESGGDAEMGGESETTGAGTTEATATPGGTTLQNHPAAADLASQPTLGPDPADAEAVVVAFEDPSCPRCRTFEQQTVPKIRSELVDTGRGSFVFRGYPVVYPWGEPAAQALESTYARSADAFWALSEHYFDQQSAFDSENVLSKTREFLASNTDLDADAVVADAEAKAHDAAVQSDLDAGSNAGAGGTTPTVFLFRDGRYQTKAAGSVSYSVVKNALGL
jgi:protein-disulfide isomerase